TRFEARFTKTKPDYTSLIVVVGNFSGALPHGDGLQPGPDDKGGVEFRIPAGVKGHTEAMRYTIPDDGGQGEFKLHAIQPHMHYVGTDASVRVTRQFSTNGDPKEECLVGTPKYDFNWQRRYAYDVPIEELPTLHGGDVLDVKCTYDNSLQNPFVKR